MNDLLGFYQGAATDLENAGQYFMAGVAIGLAAETAVLAYLLVEFGEENGGELRIPANIAMRDLIDAADEIDVLMAPIDESSHQYEEDEAPPPKRFAKEAVDKIRRFRNLIHPARALKEKFCPKDFGVVHLQDLKEDYEALLHSLLYYI